MSEGNASVPITFQVFEGDEARSETLMQDVIKVGKLESSHLRLEDENVSRMHAVIEVSGPDDVSIIDLGSASGTFVNGQKVNKAKLETGDLIQFGNARVAITIGEAVAAEETGQQAPPPQAGAVEPPPQEPAQEGYAPQEGTAEGDPAEHAEAMPEEEHHPAPGEYIPQPSAAAVQPGDAVPPAESMVGGEIPEPFGDHSAWGQTQQDPAGGALPNPFAQPATFGYDAPDEPEPGHEDEVQYQLIANGPPVSPDEVESGDQAVEVVVMWGEMSVLHVAHLSPPRAFYVGDATDSKGRLQTDYLVGSDTLQSDRLPVTVESGAGVAIVIPQGAEGGVTIDEEYYFFEDLDAAGQLQPCNELPGAKQYPLPPGSIGRVAYNGFTFVVKPTVAGKPVGVGGGPNVDWRSHIWTLTSLVVHVAFLLMFYFLPPSPSSLSLDLLNTDDRLVKYLIEPPETQEEETPEWLSDAQDEDEGGKGKRHKDDEGQMGKKESKKTKNKYGIEGPEDNQDPHMAREQAKEAAKTAGIIGVLKAATGSFNSPTSPYGKDTAVGNDPMSALGALMGDQTGENFGFGGLGLRGTGRGGGGTGEGTIGLGNVGTIGHGAGGGEGSGYGSGKGGFRGRKAKVPKIRSGRADVRGSLSKEVIRRIIRRHINEVRFCYEQELNARPDLEGRVSIKFIIAPTGAVQNAAVAGSTMNNPRVENCIAKAARRWNFPAPEGGGIVVVTYPFVLQQSG